MRLKEQKKSIVMDKLRVLLQQNLNSDFISATLSSPRDSKRASKVRVRPVQKGERLFFQVETFRNNQAFHENLQGDEASERLLEWMENMKQLQMETRSKSYTVLV